MSGISLVAAAGFPRVAHALRTCALCVSDDIEYEFVVDGLAFSRCRACTLLFANPRPAHVDAVPSAAVNDAYVALRLFASRYLGREPLSILVVHAGNPPPDPNARQCRAEEVTALDESFDLVVACDVIDRQDDPVTFAATLRARVAPGGALLATTASPASADALSQRDRWAGFRSRAHWWLTADTLQLLLTRADFGEFASVVHAQDLGDDRNGAVRRFFGSHLVMLARPAQPVERRLLSVIVPVFNEAATVAELLETVLAKTIDGVEIEVIVVESASTDGSREIVQRYATHPRLRLVFEERPRGKGHAVRTALGYAQGEVILFQDADLEYDVNDYDQLVEPLFAKRRNFILGSRHGARGDAWKIRQFADRRLMSSVMNLAHLGLLMMYNRLYDQTLFDPFTMFKVFRRDCLFGLFFECDRFDFDYEIGIKLIRKGYQPIELPVNYRSRSFGEGKKVAFFTDPPTWIRAMLRLRHSPLYRFS